MVHVDRQQALPVAQLPVGRPRLEETLVQRVLPLSGRHRQEERGLPPNMAPVENEGVIGDVITALWAA